MKLATLRIDGTTAAVRVDDENDTVNATVIDGYPDLSALLAARRLGVVGAERLRADDRTRRRRLRTRGAAPRQDRLRRAELRHPHQGDGPRSARVPDAVRASSPTRSPGRTTTSSSRNMRPHNWTGRQSWRSSSAEPAYQVSEADADGYIAGYSVINDYTMRDYQYRTLQWDQGKNFEKTSGFGPWLVTDYTPGSRIETRLDGEVMQSATTDDLVFSPAKLVEYISHIVTLNPGDVVITGTTGGVGHARKPARYIGDGQTVEVSIEGLGTVRNKTIVK